MVATCVLACVFAEEAEGEGDGGREELIIPADSGSTVDIYIYSSGGGVKTVSTVLYAASSLVSNPRLEAE